MDFAVVDMMTIFAIFKYVTFLWIFASAFMFLQASHAKLVSYNWIPQWKFYVDLAYTVFWQKPKSACSQWIFTRTQAYKVWCFLVKRLDCSHCVKKFGLSLWQEFLNLHDTKGMVSKLLVALIVIRNSAFFDRNLWNWKDMKTQTLTLFLVHNESSWAHVKTKKYGGKTFDCSHCDRKFGLLLWQEFLKFEDMKTQKVWCQNF